MPRIMCTLPPPAGYECFIGNDNYGSVTRYGQLPDSACQKHCGGDNTTTCGGTYAFELYRLIRLGG